jgi:hypothetical protein
MRRIFYFVSILPPSSSFFISLVFILRAYFSVIMLIRRPIIKEKEICGMKPLEVLKRSQSILVNTNKWHDVSKKRLAGGISQKTHYGLKFSCLSGVKRFFAFFC